MQNFIKYELDDGTVVEVETAELPLRGRTGDVMRGGGLRAPAEDVPYKFSEALGPVKAAAQAVMEQLRDLAADEIEVEFGLTANGEVGNFAIGTLGVSANYRVRMKWVKGEAKS